MKKILLLVAVLPQLLCAADASWGVDYPMLPPHELEHPVKLNPVSFDLSDESLQRVTDTARIAGLAGGAIGAAGGGYIASRCNDLSPLAKISIVAGSAGVTGGMAYLLAKLRTFNRTPEKQAEACINERIARNNFAYDVHARAYMNSSQRRELKGLVAQGADVPENRVAVYGYALDVRAAQNQLSEEQPQCRRPIVTATQYLQNKANQLKIEREAAELMNADWPAFALSAEQRKQEKFARASIKTNKQKILAFSDLLSDEELSAWTKKVISLPEYIAEDGRGHLSADCANLKQYERAIKGSLARLAALYGYTFSQAKLSSSVFNFVCTDVSTSYSNTSEGRKAKEADIKRTKNEISRLMQCYQRLIARYNAKALSCANHRAEIPEAVKQFIIQHFGEMSGFSDYQVNQKLLDYNTYLNHNDGSLLLTWIQSCFE